MFSAPLSSGLAVAAGDVNGDERPDLYVMEGQSATSTHAPDHVYLNDGTGNNFSLMSSIPSTSDGAAKSVWPIDHDSNGLTDFLVLNGEGEAQGPVQLIAFFPATSTSPSVLSTVPRAGATGVSRSTNLTATFSEKMDPASINKSTFKLFKVNTDGSTTQITNVSVRPSTDGLKATLNPFDTSTTTHLAKGTKYKGVITTGARDVAGNQLDQNTTTAGFQPKAWTFTVSP